mmetsp:Transcript_11282/g.69711  ORF Transcript_11282/g.69711 Transcript_11282/m.69711 type:complete len:329 (+) Transcript_11282:182-1168(+)
MLSRGLLHGLLLCSSSRLFLPRLARTLCMVATATTATSTEHPATPSAATPKGLVPAAARTITLGSLQFFHLPPVLNLFFALQQGNLNGFSIMINPISCLFQNSLGMLWAVKANIAPILTFDVLDELDSSFISSKEFFQVFSLESLWNFPLNLHLHDYAGCVLWRLFLRGWSRAFAYGSGRSSCGSLFLLIVLPFHGFGFFLHDKFCPLVHDIKFPDTICFLLGFKLQECTPFEIFGCWVTPKPNAQQCADILKRALDVFHGRPPWKRSDEETSCIDFGCCCFEVQLLLASYFSTIIAHLQQIRWFQCFNYALSDFWSHKLDVRCLNSE